MTPLTAAQLQERFHSEVMRGIHAGTIDVKFGVDLIEDYIPTFWKLIPAEELPRRWHGGVLGMVAKLVGILSKAPAKRRRAERVRHWQTQVMRYCELTGIPPRHRPEHCRSASGAARVLFTIYGVQRRRDMAPALGVPKRIASVALSRARKSWREAEMIAHMLDDLGIDAPQ